MDGWSPWSAPTTGGTKYWALSRVATRYAASTCQNRKTQKTTNTGQIQENSNRVGSEGYGLNVPHPQNSCWNPKAQCDGFSKWGLWEVLSYEGVVLMNGTHVYERWGTRQVAGTLPPCEDTVREHQLWIRKRVLTRTRPCWYLDLGLPSLQNCEKEISVVYNAPSSWCFVRAAWNGLKMKCVQG